jgi:hypothetical protein
MLQDAMPVSLRTPPRDFATRRSDRDTVDDSIEVPATVVCAFCGDAECTGCENELSRSGVVAMVAWERPGAPLFGSLWATARAATMQGEAFFELLPDGPIAPALRFALVAETIAAFGFLAVALPFVAILAPGWLKHVALDGAARDIALRVLALGVPGLALLLVGAHAAHGLALERGARKAGARSARWRALRFGLYASGWDLVLGPIGALVVAWKDGAAEAFGLVSLGVGLPGRCARAFLRGCYRLVGSRADKANGVATAAAVVATLIGAVAILGVAILLALL